MLSDRLKTAMDLTGITQAELARACHVSPPSVNGWLNGKAKFLRGENLLKAAAALKVNQHWLADGTGDMQPPSGLHEINDPRQAWTNTNITHAPSRGRIPMISWVKAGSFSDVQDLFEPGQSDEWVDAYQSTPSRNAFALRVEGDSMTAPTGRSFPDGCTIIVDPNRGPKPGDFVVAKDVTAQRATFKQLTSDGLMSYLKPLNPAYPTQAIDNERIRIVGVVIEWFVGGKL